MNKRGQVTLFIIIGIVLVLSVGIFLFIRSETNKLWVEKILMPEDVIPVREYVETCLSDVAREGINQIGARGGYATYDDLPDIIKYDPKARINIFKEAGVVLPLWYYRGQRYMPDIEEMRAMLADYIEKNVQKCTGKFEGFENKFDIVELSNPSIQIREKDLADNYVNVYMIYKLKITSKADAQETKISLFSSKVPIRLKKTFEVAKQVFEAETKQLFLEKQLIDLMNLNEDLTPMTYAHMSCTPLIKKVSDLKNNVKGLAQFNFPNTVINGTNTKELRPYDWYASLHQTYDIGITDAEDISVEFQYQPEWPMDFMIYPNQGRIIKAEPLKLMDIIPTCYLQYHFVYDLNFPIQVDIVDQETNNHESYIFSFAMPIIINHNEGSKDPNPRHIALEQTTVSSEDYCENYPKMPLTIRARNQVTNEDAVDVNITYRCTAFECDMGTITSENGLNTNVPRCSQAHVKTKGEGYQDSEAVVDVTKDKVVTVDMLPVKKIPFKIIKKHKESPLIDYAMETGDIAIITLTNDKYNYTSIGIYDTTISETQDIEMLTRLNHDYNLDIMLISGDKLTGGYNGDWTADYRDFAGAKELTFYVYDDPSIKNMTGDSADEAQYNILANITELSKTVPTPKFT